MTILRYIAFLALCIGFTTSYTVTMDTIPPLPSKQLLTDNSFIYYLSNNHPLIVRCQEGTYLDSKTGACKFIDIPQVHFNETFGPEWECFWTDTNYIPAKENCRYYVVCGPSGMYTMTCPGGLLWNEFTENCDYPEKVHCCEYEEVSSTVIVNNVM